MNMKNEASEILNEVAIYNRKIKEDLKDYNDHLRKKEKEERDEIIDNIKNMDDEEYSDYAGDENREDIINGIEDGSIKFNTNSLGGNILLSNDMELVIKYMTRDVEVKVDGEAYLLPIFGLLSTFAIKTPFFMYGNDTKLGEVCSTAFTDGLNIFVNDAFWRKLIDIEHLENKGKASHEHKSGRLFLLLHELSHMVHNDSDRLLGADPKLANIAFDIRINGTMEKDFPDLKILSYMKAIGVGMSKELERYTTMSPERIYELLKNAQRQNTSKFQKQMQDILKEKVEKTKKELSNQKKQGNQSNQKNSGQEDNQKKQDSQGNSDQEDNENKQSGQGNSEQEDNQNERGNQGNSDQKDNKNKQSGQGNNNQEDNENKQGGQGNSDQISNDNVLSDLANDAYSQGVYDGRNDKYSGEKQKENYNPPSNGSKSLKDLYDEAYNEGYEHGSNENSNELSDLAGMDEKHVMKPQQVKDLLNEMGVSEEVLEHLGYGSGDDDINEKVQKRIDKKIEESISETENKYRSNGLDPSNTKIPGAHILGEAYEHVKIRRKGKLNWKQKIAEQIFGSGSKTQYTENVISDIYYVDEVAEDLGTNLYIGVLVPIKSNESVLIIIDTSGSMSASEELESTLTEVVGLKNVANSSESARDINVYFADTILRGEPLEINENNVQQIIEKGVKVAGRGGTDLIEPINQVFEDEILRKKKIKSIIYFSDLGCEIPVFEKFSLKVQEMLKKGIVDLTFIAVPNGNHYYNFERFKEGVKNFAETIKLKEGETVDLSNENKRKRRMRL